MKAVVIRHTHPPPAPRLIMLSSSSRPSEIWYRIFISRAAFRLLTAFSYVFPNRSPMLK
jgi:hypothetical protein